MRPPSQATGGPSAPGRPLPESIDYDYDYDNDNEYNHHIGAMDFNPSAMVTSLNDFDGAVTSATGLDKQRPLQ